MLVGSHGYIPTPACHATPTATTVTVPSRAMCSCETGPGRSGRPLAIDAAVALSDPPASVIDPKTSSAQHICLMVTQLMTIVGVDRSPSARDTFDCR
jgi:hypothetical protein